MLAAACVAPAAFSAGTTSEAKASPNAASAQVPARLNGGKKLYRQFCGQCHALKEARALGQGVGKTNKKGYGEDGGPSFEELRVTAHQCKLAIVGVWDGHAKVMTLMTRSEINLVSDYVQAATRDHKYKATLPSDAFR